MSCGGKVASAALLAAGLIRSMAIKRYAPKSRRREIGLLESSPESYMARSLIFREKGDDVITNTSARGGFQRVMSLCDFSFPPLSSSVFSGPVLTLLAENEDDILVPSSPTLKLFRDATLFTQLFPECRVRTVRSGNPADSVAHTSLIFHHEAYNIFIDSWYNKLLCHPLQVAA